MSTARKATRILSLPQVTTARDPPPYRSRNNTIIGSWVQLEPNIVGAEIAENKIKWYLTIITIDYMDLEKKQECYI
jgi:hypothetical protein